MKRFMVFFIALLLCLGFSGVAIAQDAVVVEEEEVVVSEDADDVMDEASEVIGVVAPESVDEEAVDTILEEEEVDEVLEALPEKVE